MGHQTPTSRHPTCSVPAKVNFDASYRPDFLDRPSTLQPEVITPKEETQ
jgi:hypothetical protein